LHVDERQPELLSQGPADVLLRDGAQLHQARTGPAARLPLERQGRLDLLGGDHPGILEDGGDGAGVHA
jgi:hypothetical protein